LFKQFLPLFLFAALFAVWAFISAQESDVSEEDLFPDENFSFVEEEGFFSDESFSSAENLFFTENLTSAETRFSAGTRWYRSNSSGMALEPVASGLTALRHEYSLSIQTASPTEIPELLLPFYNGSFAADLRLLYENGKEFRRQWIFRDEKGFVRLSSSGETSSEMETKYGFIEIRNGDGAVEREFRFEDDLSEWEYRFFYRENYLLKAETWYKKAPAEVSSDDAENADNPEDDGEEDNEIEDNDVKDNKEPVFLPVSTDHYRYSRFGSIRAIDRVLHEAAGEVLSRLVFPGIGSAIHPGEELLSFGIAYTSDFLTDIYRTDGITIAYSVDSRGRILGEIWKDEEGTVIGEFRNTWSGDRLQSVHWKTNEEERLVEYEYDAEDNRVAERNFNKGVLERSIVSKDGMETEEIYMDGRLILRVLWENGLKLSEERVFR